MASVRSATALAAWLLLAAFTLCVSAAEEDVLTLDESNFTEVISKNDFVLVEFYAPWCGHCKRLAPEYEKAAGLLKDFEPKIVLAKVDANEEKNKKLAADYDVRGFPTLKIIRKGSLVQEYKGPREADGIVSYLQKQAGPASAELTSAEQAEDFVGKNQIAIIGVFKSYDGEEFSKFTTVAERLRSEYDFRHTLDASLLPLKDEPLTAPAVRLFKTFDEKFNDFSKFDPEELVKFIEESSLPLITELSQDPEMQPFLSKFFGSPATKVFFFLNTKGSDSAQYQKAYKDLAESSKSKGVIFLIADGLENEHALQHFGLAQEKLPSIVLTDADNVKYVVQELKIEDVGSFVSDFFNGKLQPWVKSEPIPEKNEEPVKVVVRDSLSELVLESGKDVLLEFYAPWCGHCKKLAPTLDEVAVYFKDDPSVVIAKLDATANDLPDTLFDVKGFPTIYLYTASKEAKKYEGDRSKEDIIEFINTTRSSTAAAVDADVAAVDDAAAVAVEESVDEAVAKDEL